MCFYCILKGLFCIGERTKTWGHGREQAILSGQLLGYLYLLVFSEKRNRLICCFFCTFCWTMGVLLEYRKPKTNILPFSLLESCKYDEFCSLFNATKKQRCDTINYIFISPLPFSLYEAILLLFTTQSQLVTTLKRGGFGKHCGRRWKCWYPAFYRFPTVFSTLNTSFEQHLPSRLQMLSIWSQPFFFHLVKS